MLGPIVLGLLSMGLLGLSARLFFLGMRRSGDKRVLERLGQGQVAAASDRPLMRWLERMFLRAGLGRPHDRIWLFIAIWGGLTLVGLLAGQWFGMLLMLLTPPLILRGYVSWRYRRRVQRMIEQLPSLLDYTVRSLKSGRTLADAVLGAMEASYDPLREALARVERNVRLGVSLDQAVEDFAELYERDEFRLFALGLRINQRFGGNASELLENLIKLIREREQGARQLSAMTGETRLTAYVLASLPAAVAAYFLATNPTYLSKVWQDPSGQHMLIAAIALQVCGCVALWRMLRSI
ncbi:MULTISPECIES: type II secretion system F family protein [Pseudomonas]|uniref:Type II secretion system F family protein n=1 Tax=Pseudomonas eucalypticola TaxID=2599595 RepID=A0A7D5D4S7_9PSED|nr:MULTISPECIES: type II secretion system F family protein [Pseudomonas]QKZ02876.1 type II secretion system F family protein [Pseudomonas eucalypticola]